MLKVDSVIINNLTTQWVTSLSYDLRCLVFTYDQAASKNVKPVNKNCRRNYHTGCWLAFLFINVTIFSTLHTGFYMILNYFYSNKLLVIRIFDNPQIFITMVTKVIPLWKVFHRKYSEITWWYVLWVTTLFVL